MVSIASRSTRLVYTAFAVLLAIFSLSAPSAAAASGATYAEPIRLASTAFDSPFEIEVRDLDAARSRAVIQEAMQEVFEIQNLARSSDPRYRGAAALEAGAGEAVVVDPRLVQLLASGLRYCLWSQNAHGPLGGGLYALWAPTNRGAAARGRRATPQPYELRSAVEGASCDRLELLSIDPGRANLRAGTRIDTYGMERGFAIDAAVEVLRRAGAKNFVVELGNVVRASGAGADGRGWLVEVPAPVAGADPVDQIYLRDQSLAVVRQVRPGERRVHPIDQRDGVPARGVQLVAAVSGLAVDTEALANTLFVMGYVQGQRQLGTLMPRPSIYWLLGENGEAPLESIYRWSSLDRADRDGTSF